MYYFATKLYCRVVLRVIISFVLIVNVGCHAKNIAKDPGVSILSLRKTYETAERPAPIPQPTSALPVLPEPGVVKAASYRLPNGRIPTGNRQSVSRQARATAQDTSRVNQRLYSVVVQKVAADEVLFALARDSELELDIIGDIAGDVTLNAPDQSLDKILKKISHQVAIRYTLTPESIVVRADTPEIRSYRVDYLNISRSTKSRVDLATQVGSIRSTAGGEQGGNGASNGSRMSIENNSSNDFWQTLTTNIAGIIGEKLAAGAAQQASENIFVNREGGIIAIRATDRQHRIIESLLDEVVSSAKRQVLIEATVVEVTLSDSFESGIDWRVLDNNGGTAVDYAQILSGTSSASEAMAPATGLLSYRNNGSSLGDVTATLKLLRQFGDVQVLSSPKIMALNNQPAVLKVVDNRVYFTFEVDRQQRENGDLSTVVDSTVHSVPIGLVMNVTPFINNADEVILNVRPTISRILNYAEDPSPALAGQTQVKNLIPEIQVREMESVMRVQSGEVAIIGGLMQNKVDNRNTGLPGVGQVPLLGKLFSRDTKKLEKTELLVFLRPTVMRSDDFKRSGDQLRRFVPYQKGRLLMGGANTGLNP